MDCRLAGHHARNVLPLLAPGHGRRARLPPHHVPLQRRTRRRLRLAASGRGPEAPRCPSRRQAASMPPYRLVDNRILLPRIDRHGLRRSRQHWLPRHWPRPSRPANSSAASAKTPLAAGEFIRLYLTKAPCRWGSPDLPGRRKLRHLHHAPASPTISRNPRRPQHRPASF